MKKELIGESAKKELIGGIAAALIGIALLIIGSVYHSHDVFAVGLILVILGGASVL